VVPLQERYAYPRAQGIFRRLPSPAPGETARNIIQRIVAKRQEFEKRNEKKVSGGAHEVYPHF
jgi:hypothetical protein